MHNVFKFVTAMSCLDMEFCLLSSVVTAKNYICFLFVKDNPMHYECDTVAKWFEYLPMQFCM